MGTLWISEKLNDVPLVILFYETWTIETNMLLLIFKMVEEREQKLLRVIKSVSQNESLGLRSVR